ncbi:MAG: DNA recombination protein RmuC [Candidatus Brocadiia bacterium]
MAYLLIGLIIGAAIVLAITLIYRRQAQMPPDMEALVARLKDSFGALSLDTLSKQTQMGAKELDEKKNLIDQTLGAMKSDLQNVQSVITNFEKDRKQQFGELSNQIKNTVEQTCKLQETTNQLRTALANSRARGQWGERMAEDVLRVSGFLEGVNYQKQKTIENIGSRPDFTFLMPQGLKVNMDVKFPLDNYMHCLEAESKADKDNYKAMFLKDVRKRIKEVTTRDYINPEEKTVDYVLVFIPNEQVYGFINENDTTVLDEALRNKVILCSPVTLYAILAIIRQAVDNFNMEKTASDIIALLASFGKQWDAFIKSFDRMGKKIDEAKEEFDSLLSVRKKQLERPLRQIDDLRRQKGIKELPLLDDDNNQDIDEDIN